VILKGGSRRGANDLALHLSNEVDNERVVVAEIRGMVADNLYDGFREWELICDQTQAKEPFYSLSINPDPNQRGWTDEEWQKAIDTIENKLGLTNQPRAVIFHEKEGEDGKIRRHCHVVWSRIKHENGKFKAIHMGQDYYKLKTCARELAKEFGLELPRGLNPENEKTKNANDNYDFAKSHGKGCDTQSAAERKKRITKIWRETQDAETFCNAMANAGYIVARGDRRAFVVVDREGGIHGLARQIAGVNAKQVKHRLGNADAYPNIEQAMDEIRIRAKDAPGIKNDASKQRVDLTNEQRLLKKLRRMAKRADQLNDARQKNWESEHKETTERQKLEWVELKRKQRAKTSIVLRDRYNKKPEGVMKRLRLVFGYEMLLRWKHHRQDVRQEKAFATAQALVKSRHAMERQRLDRKKERLRKQEIREAQTLNRYCKRLGKEATDIILRQQQSKNQNSQGLRLSYM
jgi:MobA/VirD2-like, nuclease domain